MFMNKFGSVLAAAALAVSAVPAAAVNIPANGALFNGTINQSITRTYNGIVDGNLLPGLTADINFTFLGAVGNTWNFSAAINNNLGTVDGRIASIGFSTDPNFTSAGLLPNGPFNRVVTGAAVNFPQSSTPIELCFTQANGQAPGNCSGSGGGVFANTSETQLFSLTFANAPTSVELSHFILRWQSLPNGGSGIGIGRDPGTVDPFGVPEPASWAMLIAGFGLVGAAMRRRTQQGLTVSA